DGKACLVQGGFGGGDEAPMRSLQAFIRSVGVLSDLGNSQPPECIPAIQKVIAEARGYGSFPIGPDGDYDPFSNKLLFEEPAGLRKARLHGDALALRCIMEGCKEPVDILRYILGLFERDGKAMAFLTQVGRDFVKGIDRPIDTFRIGKMGPCPAHSNERAGRAVMGIEAWPFL